MLEDFFFFNQKIMQGNMECSEVSRTDDLYLFTLSFNILKWCTLRENLVFLFQACELFLLNHAHRQSSQCKNYYVKLSILFMKICEIFDMLFRDSSASFKFILQVCGRLSDYPMRLLSLHFSQLFSLI